MLFCCKHIGMTGNQVYFQEQGGLHEARQALALFGGYQMSLEMLEAISFDPFHADFSDIFAKGFGKTKVEALVALEQDKEVIYRSLWL